MVNFIHRSCFDPATFIDQENWGVTMIASSGIVFTRHHAQLLIEKMEGVYYKRILVDFGTGLSDSIKEEQEGSKSVCGRLEIGRIHVREVKEGLPVKNSGHSKTWLVTAEKVQRMLDALPQENSREFAHTRIFNIFGSNSIFSKTRKRYLIHDPKLQQIHEENPRLTLDMFKFFSQYTDPNSKKVIDYGVKVGKIVFSRLLTEEEINFSEALSSENLKKKYKACLLWYKIRKGITEEEYSSHNCCSWALAKLESLGITIEASNRGWLVTDTRDYLIEEDPNLAALKESINGLDPKQPDLASRIFPNPPRPESSSKPVTIPSTQRIQKFEEDDPFSVKRGSFLTGPRSLFKKEEENEIPLPAHIRTLLHSRCPFWPHKKIGETHTAVYISSSFKNTFTLEMSKQKIDYTSEFLKQQISAYSITDTYWVLITNEETPRVELLYRKPLVLEAIAACMSNKALNEICCAEKHKRNNSNIVVSSMRDSISISTSRGKSLLLRVVKQE